MGAKRPVLGWGAGSFDTTFAPHAIAGFTRHAHNSYLQLFAEEGFLAPVLWAVRVPRARPVALGVAALLLALAVSSLVLLASRPQAAAQRHLQRAAIELLSHVGHYLGFEAPLGELPMQALETRALLDAATAADERTKAHVERLEEAAERFGR